MALDWFNTKEATHEGLSLANDVSTGLEKVKQNHTKKEMVSYNKAIQKMFLQYDRFEQNHKLNFYKKSKLINEFKWRLLELGHDKKLVESVTKELTLYINK